jgi:hypothetical protein
MVAKRSEHLWPLTGECPDLNAAVTRASGCVGTSGCASGCASGCVGTVDALENRCSSIKLAGNTFLLDRGLVDAFLMGTWKVKKYSSSCWRTAWPHILQPHYHNGLCLYDQFHLLWGSTKEQQKC